MSVSLKSVISPAFYGLHNAIRSGKCNSVIAKGGRGSTKSSFASVELLLELVRHPNSHAVVLRKVKDTLRTSVYAQICWAISELGADAYFKKSVSPMQITYKKTGQTIYFFGLDDPGKVKSIKVPFGHIGILWLEELDQFAGPEEIRNVEQSILRGDDYSITFKTFNPPASPRSWTHAYCREEKAGQIVHHSSYLTTPPAWLGRRFLDDAEHLKKTNERAYRNEYMGEVVGSGLQVFENIREERITDEQIAAFDRVHRGVDWGFYPDPFAYNECQYDAARRRLYIFGELTARKLGNQETAKLIKGRGRDELIRADSAEPKSVSDYKADGLPCVGAKKGPGSVEHSMKWLQSLGEIVIDPVRCPDTFNEFTLYEYEQDKAGNVMDGYPDRDNHHIDAVRYALEDVAARRVAKVRKR